MSAKIHNLVASYIDFIKDRLLMSLVVVFVITGVSVFFAARLSIKSDLKELLPENYESVRELNKMLDRIGGTGSLIVTAESPNVAANKRFMDALAAKLHALPSGMIRYIDYKSDEVKDFYERNFLYYLNPSDLDRLYKSVERRIEYEKLRRTPLFIDFSDEDPLLAEIDDIKNKNRKNYSSPVQTFENYYGGEWGRMLIMIVRPFGANLTVDRARGLIAAVENAADGLNPASFDPRMKVGYCGNVKSTVEEFDTLKKDIASTAAFCIALVFLAIVLYFLRLRVVFLITVTLAVAISWTFALTYFLIGYLNSQTAFLGSIIVGTGINYGIIIMARYVEERRKKKGHTEAMKEALRNTLSATFLAAATTAVAFSILLTAKIKGLSQFGTIGAIGVMLCWLASILVLPVLTLASEKIRNMIRLHDRPKRRSAAFSMLTTCVVHSPYKIAAISAVFAAISVVAIARFAHDSVEYDFTKLRNKTSVASGTEALEKRVSQFFKHSMTPAVVMVDNMEDAPKICSAVDSKVSAIPEEERRVGSCYSIYNLLPEDQEQKLPRLEKFRTLFAGKEKYIAKLDAEVQDKIREIRKSLTTGRVLTLSDVPSSLKKHFEDLEGNQGVVVFVNPRPGMLLSDGRNLMKFADTIREIALPDGRVFHASGASFIFSDLVRTIHNEAPLLTLASFICVILFVALVVRRWHASWIIIVGLAAGITGMCGVISMLGIKLNFFNFIALPLTFGIGVDYSINVIMRLVKDRMENVEHSLRYTGGAVILCSLTTIIGYSALIIANNQALASFGTIAIIGEFTCIAAAIVLAPALMVILGKKAAAAAKAKEPAAVVVQQTESAAGNR